ncbi:hypothetical protein EVAR_82964_1 [Eumeta japonica]|uniref:Uncharacterized protein n=1 Tax=Eumeta variegata TaxID=151549 RepID=A0A4C1VT66_EUMVA|nr:hypothetical protein EVAR_82964_1 [Eumeta japonica]
MGPTPIRRRVGEGRAGRGARRGARFIADTYIVRRYPIPAREAGNALVTATELDMSMGGGDRLFSDGSPARLPL